MTDLGDSLRHRLIPAVPVVCDAGGAIDVAANERYARWMAGQDIGGVAVWAHTGRGLLFDDAQRADVLRLWKAAVEAPIVCGVGVPRWRELPNDPTARTAAVIDATAAMARAAREGGAAAVMVHPPTALRDLPDVDERTIELYRAVGEVGLSVIAFHLYEAAGGVAHRFATLERLLGLDGVIGIKIATLDSVMTFQDLVPVVRGVPEALLITGEDRFFGYSLMLSADAALVGIGAACTDSSARLLAAWFGNDRDGFVHAALAVDRFARATFAAPMEGYVQRMLWALEADGVIPPGGRDPFAPALDSAERGVVASAVFGLRHP